MANGGAIFCSQGTDMTLSNVTIIDNSAAIGGAIASTQGGTISLINSIITYISNEPFSQFIIGNSVEDVIFMHGDTIEVNLVNNGLCDVQLENSNQEFDIQFGIYNQEGEFSGNNINKGFSIFKYDPYSQSDITMKIIFKNESMYNNITYTLTYLLHTRNSYYIILLCIFLLTQSYILIQLYYIYILYYIMHRNSYI